jgi:cell division protein FtsX
MHVVSPEYFATLGIAVERGRDFLATDGPDGQPVVIVNQATARALWPGEDPIGQRIGPAVGPARWATIVGVVSDVGAAAELREPITRFRTYAPLRQNPRPWVTLVVRTRSPATTAREIRQAMTSVDPSVSSFEARSVREDVDLLLANLSMLARLLLGFALLGLTLAALGIYGLFAGFVIQRTREIGLRMALGAGAGQVLWLVLGRGLRLALAGAALGLAGSYAAVRLLTSMATELPVYEPAAMVVLPVTLLAVALLASWLPARRAARVDPMVALRAD